MSTSRPPQSLRTQIVSQLIKRGPFLLIFGFAAALLYRLTLYREALYWGDLFLYFHPLEEHVQTSLRTGQTPLWNPYVLCGQPLIGNPQAWVIYPTTALLPFMPVWAYFTVNYLLHIGFAGLGTYLFTRRLCGDRLSGVFAALVYSGSGFLMARLQFPTMVQAAAYLPWLLVLLDRLVERPGIGYASLLAVTVALEVLAGHAQLAYMSFGAATVYLLSRLYQTRKHRERARRAFAWAASALVVGMLSTGAQILPMVQLFGLSTREKLTWAQANRFVLRPSELIHFIAPYWHGSPANGDFWGEGNLWETCVYVGIIPLILAIYAICRRIHRRSVIFFGLLAAISLWLAMGKFGGLFWIAFYVVPGLASFHDPARFTFLTTFALAVLGAYGLRALRDHGWGNRLRIVAVSISALNLWSFSAHFNPTVNPYPSAFTYRPRFMAAAPTFGAGRVFSAQRDQVWQRYLNYSDFGPDSARYVHELTDTVSPNIGMRFGLEEGSGYEPVPIRSVTEVDALVRVAIERKDSHLPALLGLFNTSAVLLPEMTRYRHPAFEDDTARGVTVLTVRNPYPRAWLVRETVQVDGSRRALAAIRAPDFDPRETAIISDGNGLATPASHEPASAVQVLHSSPGHVSVLADAGATPAFMVLSQTWYPGWRVTVDGQSAHIVRTNHAFTGVTLTPGLHRVEIAFLPAAYRVGLYLTVASVWLITVGMTLGAVKRRYHGSATEVVRGKDAACV